jgi:hypothetical protein
MLLPITVEGIFFTFVYIQTWHLPQPMTVVYFLFFFRDKKLQGERWMKLGLQLIC